MTTESDRADLLVEACSELLENASRLVAAAKERQTNAALAVYVDADGNDAVAVVYGWRPHTWKSGDTFDRLAADLLGDAGLGTLLAYFNKTAVESELEAGARIKIPVLEETPNVAGNRIFAPPEKHENYGIDIAIGDDGGFQTKNGDFASVGGQDNLSQALALRLTTASQKRIRLASYGIRSAVGDPMAMRSYLLASIEQTVMADPRVERIEGISFEGKGSALSINVEYTDINGEGGAYKGEI